MLGKQENTGRVSGKLHNLGDKFKLTYDKNDKGEDVIKGSIFVLVDEETENIIEIKLFPQPKKWSTGRPNGNYAVLSEFIEADKKGLGTILNVGIDNAFGVEINANSIKANAFYMKDPTGEDGLRLVQSFNYNGGFISKVDNAKPSAGYQIDCFVRSKTPRVDAEGVEDGTLELMVEVFDDYKETLFPLKLTVEDEAAIGFMNSNYIEGPRSEGSYVRLNLVPKNNIIQSTGEEVAFGETVAVSSKSYKSLVVVGGSRPRDEIPMTDEEWSRVEGNTAQVLAEAKNRAIEKNSNAAPSGFNTTTKAATNLVNSGTEFNF